jgi:hypothetical protein
MSLQLRPLHEHDLDDVVALALRAWAPVHASMATVLGERLNARIYPDWAADQEEGVRAACNDPDVQVTVADDGHTILGFVAVIIDAARATGRST